MKTPAPIISKARKPVEPVDPWAVVMGGLRGLRLAVYDELMEHGSVGEATLAQFIGKTTRSESLAASLAWLASHHFVRADAGVWRAVPMETAKKRFTEQGALAVAVPDVPAAQPSQPACAPAPVNRAVHASAFLDLGNF